MRTPKIRILIVDDEESIGQVLKAGLEGHGFCVRAETCPAHAIRACLEYRPALVLLDVDMPGKDGGQVAAELQEQPALRGIPVIFLTSLVSRSERLKTNADGETMLSKAMPIADLVARIRTALQGLTPA